MAETADHVTGVTVVVGVAAVWGVEAELAALIHGTDVLVYAVHGFEDAAVEFLELAEFGGFLDAVVFQVVETLGGYEGGRPGHGHAVHVGEFALSAGVMVVHGSVTESFD